jgi:signal transduction histidine kinase
MEPTRRTRPELHLPAAQGRCPGFHLGGVRQQGIGPWGVGMRVVAARWVAGCVAAASAALIAGALALALVDRHRVPAALTGWDDVFGLVTFLAVPVVGFVLASRRPANRIGRLFLAAGLALALRALSHHYGLHALDVAPGPLLGGRAAMWVSNWIWVIPLAMLGFAFLLFPDGHLRTRRWRPAAWFVGGAFTLVTASAVAIAIAVLKYRLYDIDIVISKAVMYGSLAMFITAVYAGLVVGVGTLVGNRRSPLLAALAAAVVAVAFLPVRQRAGRLANRVVYGRRATPYQVLSDFAQRIGGTYAAEEVLPQMVHIVAAGTGAEQVVVWLRVGDELRPEASSDGRLHTAALPVAGQALPGLPDADISVPVVHQGELLGAIAIRMPKAEPLRPAGAQLVADVASQAGLVLANAGLIEDLRASRQRLITAQDQARRQLERDIHDGAQQDLVALAIKLQLADTSVENLAQAKQVFGELKAIATGALENLRDLARGIYPPLLADLGLAAALNAQAGKSPLPVTVTADGIGRFPQDTEAAVYFCCLEALQNTAKYAHASQARISLQASNGTLSFTVADDGTGYDARHSPMGSGLRNMADRLAALGGRLEIGSAPGHGTTITGHLPTPATTGNQATAATDRPDSTEPTAANTNGPG